VDELTGLLRAAQQGDAVCVAAWIRRTQAEVWRLCAHLVDRESADDLTQETYIRAWKALPAFRGDASARTWLLSIARRACADALRTRVRRRRLLDTIAQRAATTHVPDQAEHLTLTALIAGLDPDRRAAFTLTQVIGLSYAEAARVCDCPVGTIRSRVARARADLLDALIGSDDDSDDAPSGAATDQGGRISPQPPVAVRGSPF
jgi:RNA polymerase sigma-70 factor (ECF subfamily)